MRFLKKAAVMLGTALAFMSTSANTDTQGIPADGNPKIQYEARKFGGSGSKMRKRIKVAKRKAEKKRKHLRRITNKSRSINRN